MPLANMEEGDSAMPFARRPEVSYGEGFTARDEEGFTARDGEGFMARDEEGFTARSASGCGRD